MSAKASEEPPENAKARSNLLGVYAQKPSLLSTRGRSTSSLTPGRPTSGRGFARMMPLLQGEDKEETTTATPDAMSDKALDDESNRREAGVVDNESETGSGLLDKQGGATALDESPSATSVASSATTSATIITMASTISSSESSTATSSSSSGADSTDATDAAAATENAKIVSSTSLQEPERIVPIVFPAIDSSSSGEDTQETNFISVSAESDKAAASASLTTHSPISISIPASASASTAEEVASLASGSVDSASENKRVAVEGDGEGGEGGELEKKKAPADKVKAMKNPLKAMQGSIPAKVAEEPAENAKARSNLLGVYAVKQTLNNPRRPLSKSQSAMK